MTQLGNDQIKGVVKERYGALARSASEASSSDDCCGTDCCSTASSEEALTLYTSAETQDLPAEALAASAGCGNPTALASMQPGETVVDFGSGGGIDCFLSAKAVGPSGRVIGIDMTEDIINLARANARRLKLSNTEFHLSDMEDTPLDENTADILISNCVINLAPDKDPVFREAFRILKPGGRLMVSDMVLVDDIPEDQAADTSNWVACLAGAEKKETYLGKMRDAGFAEVEVLSETPISGDDGWRASIRSMNIKAVKPGS